MSCTKDYTIYQWNDALSAPTTKKLQKEMDTALTDTQKKELLLRDFEKLFLKKYGKSNQDFSLPPPQATTNLNAPPIQQSLTCLKIFGFKTNSRMRKSLTLNLNTLRYSPSLLQNSFNPAHMSRVAQRF